MTLHTLDWDDTVALEGLIKGCPLVLFDTNVALGVHIAGKKIAKSQSKGKKKRNNHLRGKEIGLRQNDKKIMDYLATNAAGIYTVVIPDFIRDQTRSVLYNAKRSNTQYLDDWFGKAKSNPEVDVIILDTPLDKIRLNPTAFTNYEASLPAGWSNVTTQITASVGGRTDRALIYSALKLKEHLRYNNITIVSNDRGDLCNAQVNNKLTMLCRQHSGKLSVTRSTDFWRDLKRYATQ